MQAPDKASGWGFDQVTDQKARNRAILNYVSAYEFVHFKGPDFLDRPNSAGLSGKLCDVRSLAADLLIST